MTFQSPLLLLGLGLCPWLGLTQPEAPAVPAAPQAALSSPVATNTVPEQPLVVDGIGARRREHHEPEPDAEQPALSRAHS